MTGLNASTASHDCRGGETELQMIVRGKRTEAYAGLVDDGVLLGFKAFSVNGDVAQDNDTDLALTPLLIGLYVRFRWLPPLIEVRVVVGAQTLSHGGLPNATSVDEAEGRMG